jgi:hypothetical protein
MAKVISKQFASKYVGQNSIFALLCYESADLLCGLLLEPWFIEHFDEHGAETQKKKHTKHCCLVMSPEDNNCLFILLNLTFSHFNNFVRQCKAWKGKSQGRQCALATHRTSSVRVH